MINISKFPYFSFLKELKLENNFNQGADPEFALFSVEKDTIVSAKNYNADYDSKFGVDGNGVTAELRPSPSKSPFRIVADIRDILINQCKMFPELFDLEWHSGSFFRNYPLGGHIHFEIPFEKSRFDYVSISDILGQYVGSCSMLLDKKNIFLGRRSAGYGMYNDHRKPNHGIEYRALSSWLSSPYIAAAFLCLSRAVMYEVYNGNCEFFEGKNYIDNSDFITFNKSKVHKNLDKIWEDVTKFKLYQDYKPHIDLIYKMINDKQTWYPLDADMKETWGIVRPISEMPDEQITLPFIWQSYINSVNV